MVFTLKDILERERETSSGYHFLMGRAWRLLGEEKNLHSPLAYAAFEYRCAIERCLFELFYLIRDTHFSSDDLKATKQCSSLVKIILRSEGGKLKLQRKMMFNRLVAKWSGIPPNCWPAVIDR